MEQKHSFQKRYLALALVIATVGICIVRALQGGMVVAHRNFAGEPDRMGSSLEMLIVAALAVVFFLLMRYMERHPELSKVYVHPRAKDEGRRLLSAHSANTNVILSALLLYVALCMAGWVSFNSVLLLVCVAAVILMGIYTTTRVRQLNIRASADDSREESALAAMEGQTERLVTRSTAAQLLQLMPYLAMVAVFLTYLFAASVDCTIMERVIYSVVAVTAASCAVLAWRVSRSAADGDMFGLSNAKRMTRIGSVFALLGAFCMMCGVLERQLPMLAIALLCFVVQYVVMLFVNVFVKSIRMKNEQDLTI